jgi:hypothetical protein
MSARSRSVLQRQLGDGPDCLDDRRVVIQAGVVPALNRG